MPDEAVPRPQQPIPDGVTQRFVCLFVILFGCLSIKKNAQNNLLIVSLMYNNGSIVALWIIKTMDTHGLIHTRQGIYIVPLHHLIHFLGFLLSIEA